MNPIDRNYRATFFLVLIVTILGGVLTGWLIQTSGQFNLRNQNTERLQFIFQTIDGTIKNQPR